MRSEQRVEGNRMEDQIEECELDGDDTEQDSCFISRERSYTSGSLTDLGKKRKQEAVIDEICNDLNLEEEKEPSHKRVKPVSKLKRFSQSFQRLSFRADARPVYFPSRSWGKSPGGSSKSRNSKLWSETFDNVSEELSAKEIKRQEAIFELTQGEQSLIDDLNITKKAYFEPMLKLCIMSEDELNQIFGSLYSLIPLHEDLLSRLQQRRNGDGTVFEVGASLVEWVGVHILIQIHFTLQCPSLAAYESYCCNLVAAKDLLDYKKQNHRVDEFLRLCQESSFSRKLDLWNFLDLPRSRLVKYPLLLKEIVRHTPTDHPDQQQLSRAIELIQGIVANINMRTGESECRYYRDRLTYLDDSQVEPLIERSRVLCCHGELKNNKGAKLRVFLFEQALVVTRPVSRNELLLFQVYRKPIPVHQLVLEDLPDTETRVGGSIRGVFINSNERAKNIFRVSFRDRSRGQSHTLQANDTFNKQQWVSCIRQAIINDKDVIQSQPQQTELSDSSLEQIADLSIDCDEETAVTYTHRQALYD